MPRSINIPATLSFLWATFAAHGCFFVVAEHSEHWWTNTLLDKNLAVFAGLQIQKTSVIVTVTTAIRSKGTACLKLRIINFILQFARMYIITIVLSTLLMLSTFIQIKNYWILTALTFHISIPDFQAAHIWKIIHTWSAFPTATTTKIFQNFELNLNSQTANNGRFKFIAEYGYRYCFGCNDTRKTR